MSEALEDVLLAHGEVILLLDNRQRCQCGWASEIPRPGLDMSRQTHPVHQAAEVRSWLARLAGDAEVREAAARAIYGHHPMTFPTDVVGWSGLSKRGQQPHYDDADSALRAFLSAAGIELALGSGEGARGRENGSDTGSATTEGA